MGTQFIRHDHATRWDKARPGPIEGCCDTSLCNSEWHAIQKPRKSLFLELSVSCFQSRTTSGKRSHGKKWNCGRVAGEGMTVDFPEMLSLLNGTREIKPEILALFPLTSVDKDLVFLIFCHWSSECTPRTCRHQNPPGIRWIYIPRTPPTHAQPNQKCWRLFCSWGFHQRSQPFWHLKPVRGPLTPAGLVPPEGLCCPLSLDKGEDRSRLFALAQAMRLICSSYVFDGCVFNLQNEHLVVVLFCFVMFCFVLFFSRFR